MRDSEIVAAIVAGDPQGLAAAYDRYAAALHTYCRSLLAEPADAADAVQDTFVIAASRLAGLREPDRLRPWLYAVARNECYRRLRARHRTTGLAEAGEMTDTSADTSADAGRGASRGELRELVRAAIAGLNPGDREIIELNLRHQLDGADLADGSASSRTRRTRCSPGPVASWSGPWARCWSPARAGIRARSWEPCCTAGTGT